MSSAAALSLSKARISWIESLLTYPQGFFDFLTHALYATQRSWPDERLVRKSIRDEGSGKDGRRSGGRNADMMAWIRPEKRCGQ